MLFNTFINYTDSGIVSTLSKFVVDTELCGAVDTPEGQDVIERDLDKLQKWVWVSLTRFRKAKSKLLHLGWATPRINTGWGMKALRTALPRQIWGYW